jgi:hypothetical protein
MPLPTDAEQSLERRRILTGPLIEGDRLAAEEALDCVGDGCEPALPNCAKNRQARFRQQRGRVPRYLLRPRLFVGNGFKPQCRSNCSADLCRHFGIAQSLRTGDRQRLTGKLQRGQRLDGNIRDVARMNEGDLAIACGSPNYSIGFDRPRPVDGIRHEPGRLYEGERNPAGADCRFACRMPDAGADIPLPRAVGGELD